MSISGTPIFDFARRYADTHPIRLHMPGHKGISLLGAEPFDLTEITGADELFAPEGIIAQSEQNASELFGCKTVYSAEGSSLCIRTMLYLAVQDAVRRGRKPVVAAARNAHKAFLSAAILLDFEIAWLPQEPGGSYLTGAFSPQALMECIENHHPTALYLTSPDYLGNLADIRTAAEICHAHGVLLLVDNAHGAYLKFLPESCHPIDLGADLCCDSAHKTLPVLTGGAYLHISGHAPAFCGEQVKQAMVLFASTSPSYLILESLDLCNRVHADAHTTFSNCVEQLRQVRETLTRHGWVLCGDEPLKLTLMPKPFGYTGTELMQILAENNVFAEFADPDFLVLMPSPGTENFELEQVTRLLCSLPRRPEITEKPPAVTRPEIAVSPRNAAFSPLVRIPAQESLGCICADLSQGCPPAVPIVMCGERIDEQALRCFAYYQIDRVTVVKT